MEAASFFFIFTKAAEAGIALSGNCLRMLHSGERERRERQVDRCS